jgi:serine protease inhibitor
MPFRRFASVPVLVLALAATACSSDSPTGPPDELKALPRSLTTGEQAAIAAGNEFSATLLRQVNARKSGKNVFISPFSAAVALGMTLNGASGGTYDAMRGTLGLGGRSPQEINDAYKGLTELLLSLDRSVDVTVANAIFHRNSLPVEASFVQTSRTYFDADVRALDFDSPTALDQINGWASDRTKGLIPKVLDRITSDNVMFLMNALYFKGAWRTRFDRAKTTDAPFRRADGTTANVPMMSQVKMKLKAGFADGTQVAELPYGNGAYAMTLLLPPEGQSIDAFVGSLTAARWSTLLGTLRDAEMDVALPRFKLKYEDEWRDVLSAMGMGVAFSPGIADFSAMSPVGTSLFISKVKQDTYVEVNEEGTTAAAVTTVAIDVTSAPPSFRADRPFVFAIRERLSGTVLFVGKVATLPAE